MTKPRIDYIDIMRGITMILVVYSHVSGSAAANYPPPHAYMSSVNYILHLIRMPLFFFISGYFVYNANYTLRLFAQRAKNRLVRQLYPTILLWGLYCTLFVGINFLQLLQDPYKQGYWFTFASVEMFFLITPIILLLSVKKASLLIQNIVLTIYSIMVELTVNYFLHTGQSWVAVSGVEMINAYFPYFFMGILYKMNEDLLKPILVNKFTAMGALILFIAGIKHIIPLPTFSTGALGIIFVNYTICKIFSVEVIARTRVATALRHIGTMTLEIYLLHYFFLHWFVKPLFSHCKWLVLQHDTFFEMPIYLPISIVVVGLCLATVYVMKQLRIYTFIFPTIKMVKSNR